jgi:biopolymer transport protein ExbD
MGMQIGSDDGDDDVVSAINTTPLVDVMLVLLIIFLITIPLVTHVVPVQLPKEHNQALQTRPENINISVTKDGDVFWNQEAMPSNEALAERLKKIAVLDPQPVVQVRGDQGARYEFVGKVVFDCQRAGILKIGFIAEPPPKGG